MMSYLLTGMSIVGDEARARNRVVTVSTTNLTYFVQMYVAGSLMASQDGASGVVQFAVNPSETDPLFFLSVDEASRSTNLWEEAFPEVAANGDKIKVLLLQDGSTYDDGDLWRVYRGDAGDASATQQVLVAPIFPGGRYSYGYGLGAYGTDAYGIDGSDAAGYGSSYGIGPYGYDGNCLEWLSETLPPGVYPIKVTVEDSLGNTSTAFEDTITLATYARAVTDLVVTSYTKATDTLVLGFTATPDH